MQMINCDEKTDSCNLVLIFRFFSRKFTRTFPKFTQKSTGNNFRQKTNSTEVELIFD